MGKRVRWWQGGRWLAALLATLLAAPLLSAPTAQAAMQREAMQELDRGVDVGPGAATSPPTGWGDVVAV